MIEGFGQNAFAVGLERLEPQAELAGDRLHGRVGQRLDKQAVARARKRGEDRQ
jgi:hypothetical protein